MSYVQQIILAKGRVYDIEIVQVHTVQDRMYNQGYKEMVLKHTCNITVTS